MFARYARNLFAFRRFLNDKKNPSIEALNKDAKRLESFISEYEFCIDQCEAILQLEKGKWKNLGEL